MSKSALVGDTMSKSGLVGVVHEAEFSFGGLPNDVTVVWKIKDFTVHDGKPGDKIISQKFIFLQEFWTLQVYPFGYSDEFSEHVAVFLNCETSSKTVFHVQVKLQIVNDLGESIVTTGWTANVFTVPMGYRSFFSKHSIPSVLSNNKLIIKCDMFLDRISKEQDINTDQKLSEFSICDESCSWMKTFGEANGNKEFSDAIVRVGQEEIPAHKVILAGRSKVFRAMLVDQDGVIDLKEMDISVAKQMLRFMYTENIQALSFDKTLQLYVAAQKYDLQGLLHKCRDFLMEHLSFDNICEVIALADLHLDDILAVWSREFFFANFKSVLQTVSWATLEKEKPQFCYSLVKAVSETLI